MDSHVLTLAVGGGSWTRLVINVFAHPEIGMEDHA